MLRVALDSTHTHCMTPGKLSNALVLCLLTDKTGTPEYLLHGITVRMKWAGLRRVLRITPEHTYLHQTLTVIISKHVFQGGDGFAMINALGWLACLLSNNRDLRWWKEPTALGRAESYQGSNPIAIGSSAPIQHYPGLCKRAVNRVSATASDLLE